MKVVELSKKQQPPFASNDKKTEHHICRFDRVYFSCMHSNVSQDTLEVDIAIIVQLNLMWDSEYPE